MTYESNSGLFHRMPVVFGPTPGPRQGPDRKRFDWSEVRRQIASVTFLSDAKHLERMLPPGFKLHGEPLVTVEIQQLSALPWLAGRGYNIIAVRFPVQFKGTKDDVVGPYLVVLWENLADPIISGREELGYAKLYCEIPEPRHFEDRVAYSGDWCGHRFFELQLEALAPPKAPAADSGPKPAARVDGTLHYKYMPRTGVPGEPDVAYAALTPTIANPGRVVEELVGRGSVRFLRSAWEELPTMAHIVNVLADLPAHEVRDARLVKIIGGRDLYDQRRLV